MNASLFRGLLGRLRPTRVVTARGDALAAGLLFLLPFAVLGRALLPGKVLSPADNLLALYPWNALTPGVKPVNPLLLDVTYMFHPWLLYAASEIGQGRLPLWNPYAFAGAPFFGAVQPALLFPLTAVAYVFPASTALTLICILKFSVAGLAMYWFLRTLAVSPVAAAMGALTFMFNGALVVWAQWTYASTIMLLPAMFGVTERLRDGSGPRWVAALALVLGLELVAGYPQGALYGWLATAAWAMCRARGAAAGGGRFLARFAVGTALGALLAAVQIVPFLEYARESSVAAYRRDWLPFAHLPLRAAIAFLMPYYYGSPTGRDAWGDWNFNELTVSVGLVVWVVLPVAVVAAWRRTGTRFFLVLAGAAGAVLYGAPWVAETLWSLPLVGWGISGRVNPLIALALSALVAVGVDAIAQAPPAARHTVERLVQGGFLGTAAIALAFLATDFATVARRPLRIPIAIQYLWFLILVTLAALLALRWLREQRHALRWGLGLALVQLLSALPLAATYIPVIDASWLYPETAVIRWLRDATEKDRSRVLLGPPNVAMLYGFFAANGQDGLTPRRIEEIIGPIETGRTLGVWGSEQLSAGMVFRSPVVELLGIRHFVVPPGWQGLGPGLTLEYDGPDARAYRNDLALPRAFVVPRVRCVDDRTALRLIRERAVDFRNEALLASPCDEAPAPGASAGSWRAEIRDYRPDHVVIDAVAASAAYLVLTDTWFPGWRAWVDGVETIVWRADHAFRAVWLGPGRHEVEFRYRPVSFQIGLGLSVLAACTIAALALVRRSPH